MIRPTERTDCFSRYMTFDILTIVCAVPAFFPLTCMPEMVLSLTVSTYPVKIKMKVHKQIQM